MSDTALVQCSVLDVHPVNKGRLLALASVEIDIQGVIIVIEGVQVVRVPANRGHPEMTGVDLPHYRGRDGVWRTAIQVPEDVRSPLGDAIIERCCELGITRRVTASQPNNASLRTEDALSPHRGD